MAEMITNKAKRGLGGDIVVDHLKDAVLALLAGRQTEARAALSAVDFCGLIEMRKAKRKPVWKPGGPGTAYKSPFPGAHRQYTKCADARTMFARDGYTCRYAHCCRPTVALDVLKILSRAFADVLPYHPNWRPIDEHILYWTYSTSVEHKVPFPAGGTSDPENLITACYLCNDVKNYLPLDLLGWTIDDPPAQSTWYGLAEYISRLRKVVHDLEPANTRMVAE